MPKRRERPPFWFEETFDRIRKLEEDIFRAFSDFWRFSPFEFEEREFRMPLPTWREISTIPVDVAETREEVIVRADLPGFAKDEIRVKATENEVILEAEKKEERKEEGEDYLRQERRMNRVARAIPLPVAVIPEKAKAKFENGVLEIRLPKAEIEEEEEKEIEIE